MVDVLQFYVPRKSELWQADLYPDTRSTQPSLTAEEFAEGKNAPPKLVPVNPAAAEVKPKIQVAKKANILAQLPHTETAVAQEAPPQPRAQPQQQRAAPRVDEDMGIVPISREPPPQRQQQQAPAPSRKDDENAPNPMIPRQQVDLKISFFYN